MDYGTGDKVAYNVYGLAVGGEIYIFQPGRKPNKEPKDEDKKYRSIRELQPEQKMTKVQKDEEKHVCPTDAKPLVVRSCFNLDAYNCSLNLYQFVFFF